MKVYKFGGASINSAKGVQNLCKIVQSNAGDGLFVIVSAMGKTTNALEVVVEQVVKGDMKGAYEAFASSEYYHTQIATELFGKDKLPPQMESLFAEVKNIIGSAQALEEDYDVWYDRIVCYGELISTAIVSEYLNHYQVKNRCLDMRRIFITDDRHRDANIDMELSEQPLRKAVDGADCNVFIGQGFIGGTQRGETTTLGREGSDYSAAMAAYLLDADSVTIWKDVEGVLSADPKIFSDASLIAELTYLDAIELAYSGAQIIHPKTIKPLQNKNIPLFVRPFGDMTKQGSVIKGEISKKIDVPILIIKHNQVLISIRPTDFSFVLEDRFAAIFALLEEYRVKINLIQSSAVNLSITVDKSRYLADVVERLISEQYRVAYNSDMELITIRGYTQKQYDKYNSDKSVFLTQKTRRTLRIVRKKAIAPDTPN